MLSMVLEDLNAKPLSLKQLLLHKRLDNKY